MPWIKQDMCTGCRICIRECPVDAIALSPDGLAEIDDAECIRCGRCHDVCPQDAVRHDSEQIPQNVTENLRWVRKLLGHFSDPKEQTAFMERMGRFFKKQMKVSEQTLAVISEAKTDPVGVLEAAVKALRIPDNEQAKD